MHVAHHELAVVRDRVTTLGAARLLLNMDAELELGVAVERTSPTRWGYSLSGRIDDPTVGFVTLVVHDEAVAGAIWTPEASYEIVPLGSLGSGVHVVREVADDAHQCAVQVARDGAPPIVVPERGQADEGNTVVDVLMLWTPRREEEAGGAAAARVATELAVEYANDAFERSGAFVSLNLVGAERVEYEDTDEGNSRVLMRQLIDPNDGHMDSVHRRRDELSADLVSLDGGRTYWLAMAVPFGAFNISSTPITFVHEVGHNFGLHHERDEWYTGATVTLPGLLEHGHVAGAYGDPFSLACIRTIMAYGRRCTWSWSGPPYGGGLYMPIFSSPELFSPLDGQRLGVSRFVEKAGSAGPADAVLHLNRIRRVVAQFRPSRP